MTRKLSINLVRTFIVLSLITGLLINASAIIVAPRASDYLDSYAVSASTGINHKVIIDYEVNATRIMNSVGASHIVVQVNNNGIWTGVASYFGSTSNGMLAVNSFFHLGSISYTGIAGKQYRAIVTVYAGNSTGSDSRVVTSNTVIAT